MPTKIETRLSGALQLAGHAFLSAVFVTAELLIHTDLAARALWSYMSGARALEPCRAPARRAAVGGPRRRARIAASATAATRVRRSCSGSSTPRSVAC